MKTMFFAFALLISREKTPEARPYSVALALRITPSISLQDGDKPWHVMIKLEYNAELVQWETRGRGRCTHGTVGNKGEGEMYPRYSGEQGRDGTVPILKDGDDHDWPKGLLLRHHHVVLHVCEDCRLHEEPWRVGGEGEERGKREGGEWCGRER